ncbi:SPT3 Dosage dependent suppressor of Ty-induced promoter mutations-like protein [Neonectria magnoliae]|uniref:SPT3 Dosage dependent suppressor of Ty-induced promoter mutations-like protein n=1 Tax=Neonectria magnoliae TaxID=2732573 RepID=A0ABR1I2G4_9HYPO
MTPAPTGSGSPLIAGVAMSNGDFNDFSDDDLGADNLFDFSNSPDTLQSLESLGAGDSKAFLSPQELSTGPFPDSPNGSYHDSSSESASSKRTGSSTSSKTPATTSTDVMMDDGDVKMEWGNPGFGAFPDDDTAFGFGRDTEPSTLDGIYAFDQDDSFLDRSFDFESASSSPETANGAQAIMPSPEMPTIKTNSPKKSEASSKKKAKTKTTSQRHHKAPSQYSVSSSMNGLKTAGSREVSPMSNIVMSHDGSPAAIFNSPSPNAGPDFSRVINGAMSGNPIWPTGLDGVAHTGLDGLSNPMNFGVHMNQPISMPQQMSMLTSPTYNFASRYELRILPTPLKSRVETQIPIKMTLTPLPPGVTKLHLPAHTISKPKLLTKPPPDRSPDTLELFVTLVCTSAMDGPDRKRNALERAASHSQRYLPRMDDEENSPQNGGDVRICPGCITRERKRAARKKIKKPDEEKLWSQDEERRVIVFNTQELKEWQPLSGVMDPTGRPEPVVPNGAMQIDAPMRIACYCRHHGEKMGFNVIFTIKDFQDRVIAQAMSNPIMITDDHKTHPMAQLTTQSSMSEASVAAAPVNPQPTDTSNFLPPTPNGAFRMSPSSGDLSNMQQRSNQASFSNSMSGKTTPTGATTRALSRPGSPSMGGPMTKKRKASGSRVPNGLTMTRLDTSPSPGSQATGSQMNTATSPFSQNLNAFSQADNLFGQQNAMAPFATGPPTPSSNDQPGFFTSNRSASMDNLAMAQLYSAPASNHASRAPSPNGLRNSVSAAPQNQFSQGLNNGGLYTLPLNLNQTRVPPVIHKIIPNEGPKIGGIEVTVLGAAFFQGLEVWFGEQKATTTTFWGDSSLVCLLPPSPVAGAVAVTFKHQTAQAAQAFPMSKQPPIFKYIDDNEDKLIRTALSVLGHKMSGQMVDVSDLARRILNDGSSGWSGGGGSSAGPSSGGGGQMFSHAPFAHLESQLLKCLDLIDLDDSTHRTRLDLKRPTGHTMLHLSCSLGYHRFVAALLARGANPDARDKGGFTPLHLASIHNHPEIVRRLMLDGADSTIRSLSGLTAADVAQSRAVLRAIRRSERHIRSRSSGGSLHSRASSATSLRSLWEPMSKVHSHEEPLSVDSSEESLEYTSGDFEDEDPDDDSYLRLRRPSRFQQERERPSLRRQNSAELEEDLPAPVMAPAPALRDQFQQPLQQVQQQFQQFQQSMALHFQNLPHFPQMPDYQALQLAPFMQRMQQLVPGMSGARPDTNGEQPRWWDMTTKNNSNAPPAYEELYPQQDLDRKQASALQAACDAEADVKCASLYDQASISETVGTKTQVPSVLMIGRKNAITKEQQEQFLAAREEKLKRLSSDRNLFFIWIPLLVVMVCIGLYNYFPSLFPFALAFARSLWQGGIDKTQQLIQQNIPERVVEI